VKCNHHSRELETKIGFSQESGGDLGAAGAVAVSGLLTPASNTKSLIDGADNPTCHMLVHSDMYNKDEEETDPKWEKDIKEEFTEEASKFGKIQKVAAIHQEERGGKIYSISFEKADEAKICAENLAG
jgi:hypothetical protein